jgi:hypothetical protein
VLVSAFCFGRAVDDAGEVHACYASPSPGPLVYGHGHDMVDWQEQSIGQFDDAFANECLLAVSGDGGTVMLSTMLSLVRIESNTVTEEPFPDSLVNPNVFDLALSETLEPVILASDPEPMGSGRMLLLGRREGGVWTVETVDSGH